MRRMSDKTERQRINEVVLSASTPRTESNNFRILSGAEVNIMRDGSLDIANNVLDKLDIVGATIHSNFSQPIEVQTDRLIKAARNPQRRYNIPSYRQAYK